MANLDTGIFRLQAKDFVKAAILAGITALLNSIGQVISDGHFPTGPEWVASLKFAAVAVLAYVVKNFLTNNKDEFAKKDKPPLPPKDL